MQHVSSMTAADHALLGGDQHAWYIFVPLLLEKDNTAVFVAPLYFTLWVNDLFVPISKPIKIVQNVL